jgi:DNA processing protein
MQQRNIEPWLILTFASGLGPVRIKKLLQTFQTPEAIVNASKVTLEKFGLGEQTIAALKHPNQHWLEQTYRWCEQPNHRIVLEQDADFPLRLKEISSTPPLLYIKGNAKLLNQPQIALVGSRNPSPMGEVLAKTFAMELSQSGLVITSGLALGIDAESHAGALEVQQYTIAVQGCGLQHIYPKRHQRLAEEIVEKQGAIISEFSPQTQPTSFNFPIRNRIIAGLTLGTLVIEASLKSGSLITARYAAEFGREVFAIPGTIRSSLSRGCHFLLKQGAKLVENVEDVLDELAPQFKQKATMAGLLTEPPQMSKNISTQGLDKYCAKLLNYIDDQPISIDQLIALSGYDSKQVSSLLIFLELKGYICPSLSGYLRIKT